MLKQSVPSVVQPKAGEANRVDLLIIDPRQIMRESLSDALAQADPSLAITAAAALPETGTSPCLSAGQRIAIVHGQPATLPMDIAALRGSNGFEHVIALCPRGEAATIVGALEAGAAAVVPVDVGLDLLLNVIRLVLAGGTYAPASALLGMDSRPVSGLPTKPAAVAALPPLTPRQAAVVAALRRGKPNKLIAYELNMCESTVKVHLRTVMKKMRARSRTHLATMIGHHEQAALSA